MAARTTTMGGRGRVGRPRAVVANLAIMTVTATVLVGLAYLANGGASAASGVTPVDLFGTATGPAPVVGQPIPDLSATTVDGKPVKLSALAGSPVWLTFGASWCQPCRAENPDVEAAYERWQARGVIVIQVYMSEDASAVTDYASRVGLQYLKVPDPDSKLATDFRILGIPTHFFVDRTGVLREIKVGTLDPAAMDAALTEISG